MQIVEKHLRRYNAKTNSMVKAKLQEIVVHCTRTLDMTKKIPSQLNHVRNQYILNGAFLKCFSIFGSNFVYLCILTLSSHWYEKMSRGFTEHHFSRSSAFGKMLITLELDGIFGSNCVYLCILTLSSHWYVTRLHRASFLPVELFW